MMSISHQEDSQVVMMGLYVVWDCTNFDE